MFYKKLKSFQLFIENGWKIPNNIQIWDYLDEYIVPNIINDDLELKQSNDKKHLFFSKGNFIDKKLKNRQEYQITSVNEVYEENYEEIN